MTADQDFELHPGAALDISEIWEYIAKDDLLAARRVREDILDAIRKLVPFPNLGHRRTDLTSRFHQVGVGVVATGLAVHVRRAFSTA